MAITICHIDGRRIVYEGVVSEEDRRRIENLFPDSEIRWEIQED